MPGEARLTLARLEAALAEALLGGHAANVVVEDEPGGEERQRPRVRVHARLVDGDVERATVLFVAAHLHVLPQKHQAIHVTSDDTLTATLWPAACTHAQTHTRLTVTAASPCRDAARSTAEVMSPTLVSFNSRIQSH